MFGSVLRARPQRSGATQSAERSSARPAAFFHRPVHDWERRLHMGLRIVWPCEASLEFQSLWPSVTARVRSAAGGDEVFDAADFNPGLSRAIWCLVRHLKPRTVAEAGVGYGVVSRFILEALALNGSGHLFSVDPPAADGRQKKPRAVEPRVAERWSLIFDTTKRALPALVSRLGSADLFIHHGEASGPDMRFELDYGWMALRSGGAMVLSGIEQSGSLQYFAQRYPGHHALVGEAEPAHLDPARHDRAGLFAIVFKTPNAV